MFIVSSSWKSKKSILYFLLIGLIFNFSKLIFAVLSLFVIISQNLLFVFMSKKESFFRLIVSSIKPNLEVYESYISFSWMLKNFPPFVMITIWSSFLHVHDDIIFSLGKSLHKTVPWACLVTGAKYLFDKVYIYFITLKIFGISCYQNYPHT